MTPFTGGGARSLANEIAQDGLILIAELGWE
jgi:hypothetical protein